MREFSNNAVLSMSDSTMAVSSKYTQDLSVQIISFTFSCKWFLCFYFWAVIWSYIVDLFAALHELASASARTLLKFASSVRALLKPFGDTLGHSSHLHCASLLRIIYVVISARSCTRALKTWRICPDSELYQLKNGSSSPMSMGTASFFFILCNQLINSFE